jgi:hypothetical protein
MTSQGFRYDVEGELLTEREVIARASSDALSASAIRKRLHAGDRTWARLGRPPHPPRRHRRPGRNSTSGA